MFSLTRLQHLRELRTCNPAANYLKCWKQLAMIGVNLFREEKHNEKKLNKI